MLLIDANAILRYMLNDNITMALKTRDLIENTKVHIRLQMFAERNMDFVDCLLYAFKSVNGFDVFTFDRKLNSMLSEIPQS